MTKLMFTLLLISSTLSAQLSNYQDAGQWPYGNGTGMATHKIGNDQYLFFSEGAVLHAALIDQDNKPQVISSFPLFSPIEHIEISPDGTKLVTSDNAQYINVMKITDPSGMILLGRFNFDDDSLPIIFHGGNTEGVAFKDDNTLIAAVTPKGIVSFDITDPAEISISGYFFELDNTVYDVGIYGDYAWVADGNEGLSVIDISDVTQMSLALHDPSYATLVNINIKDDLAYLTRASNGFQVIELQTDPVVAVNNLVTIDDIGFVRDVVPMENNKVIVGDFYDGIKIYDITNPAIPVLEHESSTGAKRIATHDQIVHTITPAGFYGDHELETYDFSSPAFARTGTSATPVQARPLMQKSINVFSDDRYVVAATDFTGVALLSISNPNRPEMVSWIFSESQVFDGVIMGDLVLATTSTHLLMADISDPYNPVELPSYYLSGSSFHIEILVVDDNEVIVGGDNGPGLQWLEITQTGQVTQLGNISDSATRKIAKKGDMLAVAGGLTFSLIDFSDKSNPQTLIEHTISQPIGAIDWEGDYIYLAAKTEGVRIWDVSNPLTSSEVAFIDPILISVDGVDVHNNTAYIAATAGYGLVMYDVTNPLEPAYISRLDTPGLATKVFASDKILAIADEHAGVIVFSNPSEIDDVIFTDGFEANN